MEVTNEKPIENEIGALARTLDRELSIAERMKLKKGVLHKLIAVSFLYLGAMSVMAAFL